MFKKHEKTRVILDIVFLRESIVFHTLNSIARRYTRPTHADDSGRHVDEGAGDRWDQRRRAHS